MTEPQVSPTPADLSREDELSALFAQLVLQQSNLALMLLGKVPHPESGKAVKDLEAARRFIDTLEMLEAKTKGNLAKDESALLKQILMNLRLAFVEAVEDKPGEEPTGRTVGADAPSPEPVTQAPQDQKTEEEEHRKKFSKKY